jgi:trk system potassium uptake protein TrkA
MKVIIAGAGDVGFHLAKLLSGESQDIVIIDENQEILDYAQSHLDVLTLNGDATSIKTLRDAGAKEADLVVAATHSEQTNIITAVLAKKMGAVKTISRIQKDEYLLPSVAKDFKNIGIDELFSPRQLASKEIHRLIHQSLFTDMFEFEGGKFTLVGILVDEHCKLLNKCITDATYLDPNCDSKVIAIQRSGETIIPDGKSDFQLNDHVYFLATKPGIERILNITGKEQHKIKNIMILGGSSIGSMTASMLEKNYNVTIIEKNKEKCLKLAEELSNTLILNADGNNVEVLEEEAIDEMDAFISLTGNSETNIISSLVAKNHGVKKTIALVENIDYIHLSQNIGVDTLINRKLIAANYIFKYIRKGIIKAITSIHGVNAEVIEYEVNSDSKITQSKIKDLNLEKGIVLAGVIRGDKTILPTGDFQIQVKDKIIVLAKPELISHIEKLF